MNEYGDVDLDGELDRTQDPNALEPWEEEEFDRQAQKVQLWQQKKAMQQTQQVTNQTMNEAFSEAIEEFGMSPEEAQQLMNRDDYKTAREELKTHTKNFYKSKLGRLRDPRTGRFVSNQQARQPQQAQQTKQSADPYATAPADLPDRERRVERAREIAAKSSGRADDLDRMLEELLPSSDPFIQYG